MLALSRQLSAYPADACSTLSCFHELSRLAIAAVYRGDCAYKILLQISVQWPWGDGLIGERQSTARIDMFHAVGVQHRRSFLEGFFSPWKACLHAEIYQRIKPILTTPLQGFPPTLGARAAAK